MDYDDDSDDEDSDFSLHWLFLLVTGTFTGMLVSLAAFACVLSCATPADESEGDQ